MHLQLISLFFFAFSNGAGGDLLNPKSFSVESSEEVALEKWKRMDKNMRSTLESALQQFLPVMVRSSSDVDLSPECMSSLLRLMIGLRQLKEIPLKMIDASAKVPSGLFSGTVGDFGNFDQCLDLVESDEFTKETILQGQYCLVELRPPLPPQKGKLRVAGKNEIFKNYTIDNYVLQNVLENARMLYYSGVLLGVCIPSVCRINDMQNIIAHVATLTEMHGVVHNCEIKEAKHIDELQYGLLGIIGLIVLLSVLGTVVTAFQSCCKQDTSDEKKKSVLSLFFTSFSIEHNVHQLLKVEERSGQDLTCIHGIRLFSMAWVILGHTYLVQGLTSKKNAMAVLTTITDPASQIILNAFLAMQIFFCIGGLVMSYSVLKAYDSQKKFLKNLPLVIFRKIWRLLPSVLLVTAVQILLPLTSSGPLWNGSVLSFANRCRENWYLNILFVANYYGEGVMCLPHLWYLSMDMQFFIAAIILMIIFYWKQKWNLAATIILIISSIIITSAITFWKDFFPVYGLYSPDIIESRVHGAWIYMNPTTHLSSYCIGLIAGIIIVNKKKINLHPLLVAACWCATTALALLVIHVPLKWVRGEAYNTAELLLFSGFSRPVFAICVAWVVFACVNGYGGVINRILSWNGFVPLSRLTFLAYLWHPVVVMHFAFRVRDASYFEHHVVVSKYITFFVVSYAVAFVVNSVFDGPVNNLTKILVERLTKGREKENLKSDSKTPEATTTFSNA